MSVIIDLTGKVGIVTGGTRGIGKSIGQKLLDAGAEVILTGTKHDEVKKYNDANINPKVRFVQLDLLSDNSVNNFLDFVSSLDRIDILVNNAGINIPSPAIDAADDVYSMIMKVNVESPFKLCKNIGKIMIQQEWGRIINIASIWSVVTRPGRSIYATSKMALLGLTKTLSVEWAKHDVLVNAVSPGFTLTELTYNTNTKEEMEQIVNLIPQKRMAMPEEIANVVLFLASEMNSYISGQNIVIDGGYTDV